MAKTITVSSKPIQAILLKFIQNLLQPPPGMTIDFLHPAGAPALIAADSISWRVFANPVSLFIGGVAAVLLELAEPSVRSGVWDHSSFQRDPLTRLKRTGFAAMVTVYAPREQAEKLIARVVKMHGHVKGQTPDGLSYEANDTRLLNWVQATASFGFCEAYHQYVQPLTLAEKSQALAEGQLPASLYGATGAPSSWPAWEELLTQTAPSLESSDIIAEFLHIMERAPILPAPLRSLQKLLINAAVEMTPEPVRSFAPLQSRGLNGVQRASVKILGRLARWLPLPGLPVNQARQRMRSQH